MFVVKRNGEKEEVAFEKVQERISKVSTGLSINATKVAQGVLTRIVDGISTTELDTIAANLAFSWSTSHPDYGTLAARVAISNHQKNSPNTLLECIEILESVKDRTGTPASLLAPEYVKVVRDHTKEIESRIDYSRDFLLDYFGFKTLERAYLLRDTDRKVVERPQHLWMRVALGLWSHDLPKAFETYDMISRKLYTHATPTLFNAGTKRPQLSSCFVPGTLVHTIDGVKPIETVKLGNKVVTHTGSIKTITQLHTNSLGERTLYDIKIAGTPSITVTGNHRIYSLSDEHEKWGQTSPSWNAVEYLRVGDWIALPNKKDINNSPFILDIKPILEEFIMGDDNNIKYRYEYTEDNKVIPYSCWERKFPNGKTMPAEKTGTSFNRFWTFDDDMMELLGIWFGDGCVTHCKNSKGNQVPRSISIVSFHNNETLIEFVTNTLQEKLGVSHVTVSHDKHGMVSMIVNNHIIARIFKQLFNCRFDGKRLPSFFNTLQTSCIKSFLAGLISSDGCVSKDGTITIQLTNPKLVTDIFYLARSVSIPITVTFMSKEGSKATGRMNIPSYVVYGKIKKYYDDLRLENCPATINNWKQTRIINGVTFMRLNGKVKSANTSKTVYTLGVEDDHSYSIGGIIAENCFLLSMKADSIHGIYDTLKDCALISQYGGGIGLHISDIRAQGSLIKGTGGISNGIVPMMRVYNNTARYVDQCFTPETRIYTRDGVKAIGDVGIGDAVLGSDGEFHAVKLPVRHMWKGDILHIHLKGSSYTVRVTPEHQILAVTTSSGQAEFTDAKDLRIGDYLVFPKPQYEIDIQEFSEEDCRLYAILLAMGSFTSDMVTATLSEQHVQHIEEYLQKRGIQWKSSMSGNLRKLQWSIANPGWKFTSAMFQKFHTPFLHLPSKKAKILVEVLEALNYRECSLELWYLKLKLSDCWLSNGTQLLVPIENITENIYSGLVHDFEVEGPHDYVVGGLGVAHNGGGKRNGSFAMYLEPWHADVEAFLEMKKNTGSEEERARDLFYALWIPDLFMERVDSNGDWTLFCPNEAPGLADAVGEDFKALYECYEREGRGRKTLKAQKLWFHILDSQIETGTPYLLYKDAANLKSNQQNLGTIKSSNLCVAPETRVLTREGEFAIMELHGKEVEVWNGNEWSQTRVEKTGENQPVLGVDIMVRSGESSGIIHHIECTPYHKFLIKNKSDESVPIKDARRIEAKDLCRGDCLTEWVTPDGEIMEAVVWDIFDYRRTCDTYCFNEPLNHAGVFNGILTGNCTEIIEYSSPEETAVCNLASLSLPAFVKDGAFDFKEFRHVVNVATRNLNRVIDVTYYPIPEAKNSNLKHRPIGLGVQGLADVFAMLNLAWESEEAADLNKRIFAHMYYAAVEASCDLAAREGTYESYHGSPAQKGKLQFDLWGSEPLADPELDWDSLQNAIRRIGLRNSLLVAPMPTASTSQILGNCECFEPYATHIFTRRTLAGEFIVVNKHLVRALLEKGLWSDELKNKIIGNNGSVQGLAEVPEEIQKVFKTVWEIKQKTLIDMAADRGPYICQSQSLNLFLGDPDYRKLTSMHFYAWRKGLKTGIYYLRTRAVASAQKFTVEPVQQIQAKQEPAECLMCSS